MNIYEKLQTVRVAFQNLNVKKTGKNTFAGYDYYDLGDILPPINDLMQQNGLTSFVTFDSEVARLTLVNVEKPDERIEFTSPMATVSLKGAHDIQNLGAVETYQRRYLYMAAFEIVEHDFFDATQGKQSGKPSQKPQQQKSTKKDSQPQKPKSSKLSKESADAINRAIKEYSTQHEMKIAEVVKVIERELGKPMGDCEEIDVDVVMQIIDNLDSYVVPF